MSLIGKRSFRSALALVCVAVAGATDPSLAKAAEFGCGYATGCSYACDPAAGGFCEATGCNAFSCDHSYSCGLFMVRIVCSAGAEM